VKKKGRICFPLKEMGIESCKGHGASYLELCEAGQKRSFRKPINPIHKHTLREGLSPESRNHMVTELCIIGAVGQKTIRVVHKSIRGDGVKTRKSKSAWPKRSKNKKRETHESGACAACGRGKTWRFKGGGSPSATGPSGVRRVLKRVFTGRKGRRKEESSDRIDPINPPYGEGKEKLSKNRTKTPREKKAGVGWGQGHGSLDRGTEW